MLSGTNFTRSLYNVLRRKSWNLLYSIFKLEYTLSLPQAITLLNWGYELTASHKRLKQFEVVGYIGIGQHFATHLKIVARNKIFVVAYILIFKLKANVGLNQILLVYMKTTTLLYN